jgi:hypothetical protein
MSEIATAEAERDQGSGGVNIGEFHLDAASGRGWTYRMYLHDNNQVRVNRVHPDPHGGIAEAINLDRYGQGEATFVFPSTWAKNGNAARAELAIVNAYQRALAGPVAASIRFGDCVFVMTTEPGSGVARVEEEQKGAPPCWVATLTALHRDYMQVQVSWNPHYKGVFGTDPLSDRGQASRYRLARAASELSRSADRHNPVAALLGQTARKRIARNG